MTSIFIGRIEFFLSTNGRVGLLRELNTLSKLLCTEFSLKDKFPKLAELHQLLENNLHGNSVDE